MQLENSFSVGAPPDKVFAYLIDVNKVVGCVPGAELSEVVDPTTFKGKVKIKVGPITVAYSGTAKIVDRNDAQHTATLEAEGRETTGPGSATCSPMIVSRRARRLRYTGSMSASECSLTDPSPSRALIPPECELPNILRQTVPVAESYGLAGLWQMPA